MDEPAVLYLVVHGPSDAAKIGIANMTSGRLRQHTSQGWVVAHTWTFNEGHEAHAIEQSVLDWWRNDLGLPPALGRGDMPQGDGRKPHRCE